MGSGTACILRRCGFKVILSEIPNPEAIRRTVTFSDAVFEGHSEVEDVRAKLVQSVEEMQAVLSQGEIPLFIDNADFLLSIKPHIYIDARMLKEKSEGFLDFADFTVGLGAGFQAGRDCSVVIETMRGHNLGKIIYEGGAMDDTKTPAELGGESVKRVIYSEQAGMIEWKVDFGDIVKEGEVLGQINDEIDVCTRVNGVVRGLISPRVKVRKNMKIADVDPRGLDIDYYSISDKARSIGRGALEAILVYLDKLQSEV